MSCSGSWLYVWDINGRPLSNIDTNAVCPPVSPQPKQQQILCVAFSQMNDWDRENVIMSGGNDGVVRMFSMDLVEKPITDVHQNITPSREEEEASRAPAVLAAAGAATNPKDLLPDEEDKLLNSRKISLNNQLARKLKAEQDSATKDSADGFVLVSNPLEVALPANDELLTARQRYNSDGYVWKRQLVFRAKLTMHTAFGRPDNADPAAVTALAISDDNEKGNNMKILLPKKRDKTSRYIPILENSP